MPIIQGTSDSDNLVGDSLSADTLYGYEGDDYLDGAGGNDKYYGSLGNDVYVVHSAGDVVVELADEGHDGVISDVSIDLRKAAFANLEFVQLTGTANLRIDGSNVDNVLYGNDGDNKVYGYDGNDMLDGGLGNDALYGGNGDDTLYGGDGNDTLAGGAGNDTYALDNPGETIVELAYQGIDTVLTSFSIDLRKAPFTNIENVVSGPYEGIRIDGNNLNNNLQGSSGNSTLYGHEGNDTLEGQFGDDILSGDEGNDVLTDDFGNNQLLGGTGNDLLTGGFGNDTLDGGAGQDTLDAGSGDNTLRGGAGNDSLEGGYGNDILDGGTGNDTLNGDSGDDRYLGGDGNDSLQGGYGNDTMDGGAGRDTLVGDDGDNVLNGGADNDLLTAGGYFDGNNILNGGAGNDVLTVTGYGNNTLEGGTGQDTLTGGDGSNTYVFGKGDGQDTIVGTRDHSTAETNVLVFKAGVASTDVKARHLGNDLELTIGTTDKITVTNFFDPNNPTNEFSPLQQIQFTDGNVVWGLSEIQARILASVKVINGTAANNTLTGTDGNDSLFGAAGNDSLVGGKGDDTLNGGTGNDTLVGGLNDDVYVIDSAKDVIVEKANEGNDTVVVAGSYSLAALANVENISSTVTASSTLTGNAASNRLTVRGAAGSTLSGLAGDDTLDGGSGNDILDGGTGNNSYLFGLGDGHDTIVQSSDTTAGRINTLLFKHGIQQQDLSYKFSGASDLEITLNDHDKVTVANFFSGTYGTVDSNPVQRLAFVDSQGYLDPYAVKAQILKDDNLRNGGEGNDTLEGGDGNDTLNGGAGNDLLSGDYGDDLVNGDAGDDSLMGGYGNDTLNGGDGNDTLDGGSMGSKQLNGGTGNNTYIYNRGFNGGSPAANTLTIAASSDTTAGRLNTLRLASAAQTMKLHQVGSDLVLLFNSKDKVTVSGFFTAGNPVQQISFADSNVVWDTATIISKVQSNNPPIIGTDGNDTLTGDFDADSIVGGAGDDAINGAQGPDTLVGGLGNDSYTLSVDDLSATVVEQAGEGTDIVTVSGSGYYYPPNINYFLADNVENMTINAQGGSFHGNAQDNVLIDNAGPNGAIDLYGEGGNDRLIGSFWGSSDLHGGAGNDTYVMGRTASYIFEDANAGIDTIEMSSYYSLNMQLRDYANFENIVYGGYYGPNIVGNDLDNVITAYANISTVIDGGKGADTYRVAGRGLTYVFDNVGDNIDVSGQDGDILNLIRSSISVDLQAQHGAGRVELTGSDNLNAWGTAGSNALIGNDGDNRLEGRGNDDTMIGGLGNDLYVFTAGDGKDALTDVGGAADVLSLTGIAGSQLVFSQVGSDLNITFTGLTDQITVRSWFDGTGNQLETIQTADASVTNQQVNQLIQTMAAAPAASAASSAALPAPATNNWTLAASV